MIKNRLNSQRNYTKNKLIFVEKVKKKFTR